MAAEHIETEIKLRFSGTPQDVRTMLKERGYREIAPRALESDQLFDRPDDELRRTNRLLRLRESGERAIVTYKGPPLSERHKSREEIEFEVSDGAALRIALDRLGYLPRFRYEKYRTVFRAPGEDGIVTIDETPIGIFLELEGPPDWIDESAKRLGFSSADYLTSSYASLYKQYGDTHKSAPPNMIFEQGQNE